MIEWRNSDDDTPLLLACGLKDRYYYDTHTNTNTNTSNTNSNTHTHINTNTNTNTNTNINTNTYINSNTNTITNSMRNEIYTNEMVPSTDYIKDNAIICGGGYPATNFFKISAGF
jgi:hypothetical protein